MKAIYESLFLCMLQAPEGSVGALTATDTFKNLCTGKGPLQVLFPSLVSLKFLRNSTEWDSCIRILCIWQMNNVQTDHTSHLCLLRLTDYAQARTNLSLLIPNKEHHPGLC